MYFPVRTTPAGTSTPARMAHTVRTYGYDGLVVLNHGDEQSPTDWGTLDAATDVDVVPGVEIRAEDPAQASGYVGHHRESAVVLAVHGGSTAMNRFAVEQPAVDVLSHPLAGDGEVDQSMAVAARENGVSIELSLAPVLGRSGGERVRAIQQLERCWRILDHYDTPYVVGVGATSHLDVRAPRDLAALGELFGADESTIRDGLAAWERLAERNRDRLDGTVVEPGVQRGPGHDETDGGDGDVDDT